MLQLAFVALFGALGTSARYGIGLWLARQPGFPWHTLTANVLGSFAIVLAAEWLQDLSVGGVDLRTVVATGALGGFTTYSAFNLETLGYLERGEWGRAAAYLAMTFTGCMAAGALGLLFARAIR